MKALTITNKIFIVIIIFLILIILGFIYLLYIYRVIPFFSSTYDTTLKRGIPNAIVGIKSEVIATNLEVPWATVFVEEGKLLVTERRGKIKVVDNKNVIEKPALDLTSIVDSGGEQGLMGMVKDPDYKSNRYIYIYYAYKNTKGETVTRLARYEFKDNDLINEYVLIENIPSGFIHAGGEIKFGPDGKLYIGVGEGNNGALAQDKTSLGGKILRINKDGTFPIDNPFVISVDDKGLVNCGTSRCEIYSMGHRNPQGLAWKPISNELYESEHGPSGYDGGIGNDELNLIRRGLNYGWPKYMGEDKLDGFETPIELYNPAIAPSSIEFYDGSMFPELKGQLLMAALRGQTILRMNVNNSEVKDLGNLIDDSFGRIRDINIAGDGSIYFTTSNNDGRGTQRENDDKIIRLYR